MKKILLIIASICISLSLFATQGDTLRVLAVGNSFTDDTMDYIPQVLEGAGVSIVIVGKLTRGGYTIEDHINAIKNKKSEYQYWKTTGGSWSYRIDKVLFEKGFEDEK